MRRAQLTHRQSRRARRARQTPHAPAAPSGLTARTVVVRRDREAPEACPLSRDTTLTGVSRPMRAALRDSHLDGCELVVTLEPCTMCAGAIQLARLARVVLAAWEPRTGACGSVRDVLRDPRANHRVEVVAGVRERESEALLRGFFAERR